MGGDHDLRSYYLSGIVFYRVSSYYLKPKVASMHGITNMIRRMKEEVLYVCPPLALGYLTYLWADEKHVQLGRKDPNDYIHDT
ncbi:unnamed protein product [Ceutorhynchus assimilis]|uniref:Cytochrome b-c1 complex subunit 8 n=1 Tax=Ceutorhynchus assimilis TaxID=467358 RepID=A0A9N9QGH4_9CUCU|nr:unnamed protein product [Ceutorhynchus assimilis]